MPSSTGRQNGNTDGNASQKSAVPGQSGYPWYTRTEKVDGEHVFEVLALGTRGAGKTIFLSALYHQLSVTNVKGDNFFVKLPENQRMFLVKTYEQLTDPTAEWPPGSISMTEYQFRCFHISADKSIDEPIPLFRFNYLDFPGSFLTDDIEGAEALKVAERTQQAHSILILIDGQKIVQAIERIPSSGKSLNADLDTLIPWLQNCARRPVHFMITKWDILENTYTFKQVREVLLKNLALRNFVELRSSQNLPVHLIPVSALGRNYATFDRSEMRMKKLSDGTMQPYNVELSMGMTMTDQLLLLSKSKPSEGRDSRQYRLWVMKLMSIFTKGTSTGLEFLQIPLIRVEKIAELMDTMGGKLDERMTKLKSEIEEAKKRGNPIELILAIQATRRSEFQAEFPESDLCRAEET